jgi:hypothetical protein
MVLLFCPYKHPKLQFALSEIFGRRAPLDCQITTNAEEYTRAETPFKINYSDLNLPGLRIYNSGWLNHAGLDVHFKPAFAVQGGTPCLFPETGNQHFDLFAMCFWLLSRYEEYQPFTGDRYGRFCLKDSCLSAAWAELNYLDIQVNRLFHALGIAVEKTFQIIPTADIDIAFKYAARPGHIRFAGYMRDFFFNRKNLKERQAARASGHDPYDVYAWLRKMFKPYPEARIFWQMNRSRNGKDRQVNIRHPLFLECVKECSAEITPGIHPSWESNRNGEQLSEEIKALASRVGKKLMHSRQHFLACRFPETFRRLDTAGIRYDYTMAWAEQPGFRAGTAYPFAFYDVLQDTATPLCFIPTCAMDVSYASYRGMSAAEAAQHGLKLRALIQQEGGVFCFIVHNESMSETGPWQGWKQVVEAWLS